MPQDEILTQLQDILSHRGVIIAPEKVQKAAPWKYLGWHRDASNVKPQKVQITLEISTVHDVQKPVEDIQWVRNLRGITNDDMDPLVELLGTSACADEKREMTELTNWLQRHGSLLQGIVFNKHGNHMRSCTNPLGC